VKVFTFVSCAGIGLFFASCLLVQSTFAQNASASRALSVVHVQQLAMPAKAARAADKGSAFLMKHEWKASLVCFQRAIQLAPDLFPAYHNLALAQYNLGRFDDAAQNFEKAIDLSKGSFAPSFFGLAIIFYDRARYVEAQSIVKQGLLAEPGSAVGEYCLGLTQYSLGHISDAQHSALEALRSDPSLADAHLLLAHIHERLHERSAVVADVDSYFKQASNDDLRTDALALLQRAQQDPARISAN
jgi:tetratricopeptide (TPR) repeat protein